MKKLILSILTITCFIGASMPLTHNHHPASVMQHRRQGVSYSTSVIHQDPKYPDQAAESSVNVNFNDDDARSKSSNRPSREFQSSLQQYSPNNYNVGHGFLDGKPNNGGHATSQLYNVGYSVSFTNGVANKPIAYSTLRTKTMDDDGEIITGIRKQNEPVEGPTFGKSSPSHNFVTNALSDGGARYLADNNKYLSAATTNNGGNFPINSHALFTRANLSPTTQKNFKILEEIRPITPTDQSVAQRYTWHNLSPGVEIIRSTEIPVLMQDHQQSGAGKFDHAKALGKSQGFDYTNAMERQLDPQSNNFFNKFNNLKSAIHQQNPQNSQLMMKYPIDTSLLRDPVITMGGGGGDMKRLENGDPTALLPVHFDARLIHEAMNHHHYPGQHHNYMDGAERPQPSQYRPIPIAYDNNDNNIRADTIRSHHKDQDLVQDYPAPNQKYQYKMYGKPQKTNHIPNISYRDEPMPSYSNQQQIDFATQRQPRFANDEYNLQTNLRPPPFASNVNFQRRMFIDGY